MTVVEATVEITKAALPMSAGSSTGNPEEVAAFLQVVHAKLKELNHVKLG